MARHVAFGSRELKGEEVKYHSSKLEFLALKWAITEQFQKYLQYRLFTVLTDNNPAHLCSNDAKSGCPGPPMGCHPGRL